MLILAQMTPLHENKISDAYKGARKINFPGPWGQIIARLVGIVLEDCLDSQLVGL
jgi:hypothetical protein